jgi:hypothetical protein
LLLAECMLHSTDVLVAWASFFLLAPPTALTPATAGHALISARVAACDAPTLSLPESIVVEEGLRPLVRWTLEHSPRFRQQCRTLAAARQLSAQLVVNYGARAGTTRARTIFRENNAGALAATVEIHRAPDLTELLAHELEHVIEQLDGVDLEALTRRGEARRLVDGAYETNRAVAAGLRVAGEVLDNTPDRVRGASKRVWNVMRRVVRPRR